MLSIYTFTPLYIYIYFNLRWMTELDTRLLDIIVLGNITYACARKVITAKQSICHALYMATMQHNTYVK